MAKKNKLWEVLSIKLTFTQPFLLPLGVHPILVLRLFPFAHELKVLLLGLRFEFYTEFLWMIPFQKLWPTITHKITLVLMWNSAQREKFNFCFSRVLLSLPISIYFLVSPVENENVNTTIEFCIFELVFVINFSLNY